MSLLFFLKPKFFDGTAPTPTVEAPDPWHPFDAREYRKYRELIQKKYKQREPEPEQFEEEDDEEAVQQPPAPKKKQNLLTSEQFWQMAQQIAQQAENTIQTSLVVDRIDQAIAQLIASQQAAAWQAQAAAQQEAMRQQLIAEMLQAAEMELRRKIAMQEEETLLLFAFQED